PVPIRTSTARRAPPGGCPTSSPRRFRWTWCAACSATVPRRGDRSGAVLQERIAIRVDADPGRSLAVLVVGAAMMQAAVVVAATASTLMFATAFGDRWGSLPGTATVLGAATGSVGLARLMRRTGRRTGLIAAYSIAAAG